MPKRGIWPERLPRSVASDALLVGARANMAVLPFECMIWNALSLLAQFRMQSLMLSGLFLSSHISLLRLNGLPIRTASSASAP